MTPIATATNTAGPPIPVGSGPFGIAITPDGKTAYVTNYGSGTVTPIATATNTAGMPITTGSDPYAIAITPATVTHAPAFTSSSAATAAYGAPFTFTVTATGDPAPTITRTGRLPSGLRFTDNKDGTATIIRDSREGCCRGVPADPDRHEQERDRHPGVHPDRDQGPGPPEDPDNQSQGRRCAAPGHPGHGIPASGPGRIRATAQRPDLHR